MTVHVIGCNYTYYMQLHDILHEWNRGVRHYMLNYELYMRFTCMLHPGCIFHGIKIVISAENLLYLNAFVCNGPLHASLHEKMHYMQIT